jgi:acylphosphatase
VERISLEVRGRVQGVGFRWFAKERADELGITGWVRNQPDGTVSIEAQGPSPVIAQFTEEIRQGPRTGNVGSLTSKNIVLRNDTEFSIKF